MPTFDTFSKRNRQRPPNLSYDSLPPPLRYQCLTVIRESIGKYPMALDDLDLFLQREHPTPSFVRAPILSLDGHAPRFDNRFYEQCITEGDFYESMDAIEMAARVIHNQLRYAQKQRNDLVAPSHVADRALDEMNERFIQHSVGYQFSKEQRWMVRVDSALLHDDVTKPAMLLLTEPGFEGAAQEFETAHQHYRRMLVDRDAGKDAVAWAVKAVESTAKAIMEARSWPYEKNDTIAKLLTKTVTVGLVPAALQSYFDGLRTALTSGLPTIGNAMARHGQGAKPTPIEEHMVTLAMHLAAVTIRFLVEAHNAKE